uniref:Secreted phosphoprotein 1 n=1 Tax=Globodera pallida TaxID=36090 RepID=A0A183BRF7_GLOPA
MSKITLFCLVIAFLVCRICLAQNVQPVPAKGHHHPLSKSLLPRARFRRHDAELTTTSTNTDTMASKSAEEAENDKNSDAKRKKREEDDDTPMHDGDEMGDEDDKSDVGLDIATNPRENDTGTTTAASAKDDEASETTTTASAKDDEALDDTTEPAGEEAETTASTHYSHQITLEARKKRDENPEKEPFGPKDDVNSEHVHLDVVEEKADLKGGGETSGHQTAAAEEEAAAVHSRDTRASATNNKAKMDGEVRRRRCGTACTARLRVGGLKSAREVVEFPKNFGNFPLTLNSLYLYSNE